MMHSYVLCILLKKKVHCSLCNTGLEKVKLDQETSYRKQMHLSKKAMYLFFLYWCYFEDGKEGMDLRFRKMSGNLVMESGGEGQLRVTSKYFI